MKRVVVSFYPIFNDNAKNLAAVLQCQYIIMPTSLLMYDECFVYASQNAPVAVLKAYQKGVKINIMQSEQSTSPFWIEGGIYLKILRSPKIRIIDWSPINANRLQELNCQKMYTRFTYLFSRPLNIPVISKRPIDIFFCGVCTPYREQIINALKIARPDMNIKAVFDYSLRDPLLMTNTLLQCKIVLNMPCYDSSALECHRINQAITCGCKVISTKSSCKELNNEYEPYITFTNNIVNTIRELQINENDNYDVYKRWIKDYVKPMAYRFIDEVKSI